MLLLIGIGLAVWAFAALLAGALCVTAARGDRGLVPHDPQVMRHSVVRRHVSSRAQRRSLRPVA